jgi:hypothetical protein
VNLFEFPFEVLNERTPQLLQKKLSAYMLPK